MNKQTLMDKVEPFLDVDGHIIYSKDHVGSHISILMEYFFSRDAIKGKPIDANVFKDFCVNILKLSKEWFLRGFTL